MVSHFDSIEDLAYQCAISACVPYFTKFSPYVYYKGEFLCDGGFTGAYAQAYSPPPPPSFLCCLFLCKHFTGPK